MCQAYGKTIDEWGMLPGDVRYFHERAWREEQERRSEQLNEARPD